MIEDVLLHMLLEAIGGAILVFALRRCPHLWHRAVTWVTLAAVFSYVTVLAVG